MNIKRMVKASAFLLILTLLLSISISVFASPDVLPADAVSTAPGFVTLKAPDQFSSSTTNKKLPISATAPQGTLVTVYRYNPSTDCYHKIVTDDIPLESVVGSTTLFAGQVDLAPGMNKFIIRGAWDEETYSIEKFDVTVFNEGFMDRIKGVMSLIFS